MFVEQNRVRRKVLSVRTMEGSNWHRSHVTVQPDGDWQVRQGRVLRAAGGDEGCMEAASLSMSPCTGGV